MIRRFQTDDLEDVMLIWLNANIEAHHFVDPGFWRNSFDTVKAMIPQAEVYVSYEDGINGFVGIIDNYIAGIFVASPVRASGIGSQLLDCAKKTQQNLCLRVYKQNTAAVSFYLNRGFRIDTEQIDLQTSEYTMTWNRSKGGASDADSVHGIR